MASVSAPSKADTKPTKSGGFKLSARDRRILDSTFSIDTRALAVIRILMAGLILYQSLVIEWGEASNPDGLYEFVTQYAHVALVPFALMMLVGYRTRLAVIVCWLLYSLPIRADLMAEIQSPLGYYTLNLGLFWSMFLPLGRHLSIDAWGSKRAPQRFLSVASLALLFQIFIVYFSAGLYKDMGEWLANASAMESILANPRYMTPLGTELLDYPTVLAVMSIVTIVIEIVGSLLVIVPGKTLVVRRLVVVPVFVAFHIGIAMIMGLGLFPYVMIALWLLFLPPKFWEVLWDRLGWTGSPAQAFTDGNRWRNGVAGVAVLIATISNLITWISYPQFRNIEGVLGAYQDFATFLLLYQQWLMFNVPSMIPT